jgi:endonuclease YncB( thermonuclease family)
MTRIWTAAILGLMMGACQPAVVEDPEPGPGAGDTAPVDLTTGDVVRVNDGDSMVVETGTGDVEVRMMGINTPERDECFGVEAEDRLIDLVDGQEVGLEELGRDQFDRTLAYVWLEGLLVNLDQVEGGFAIATTSPEEGDPHGDTLLDAEDAAFEAGQGMWSETVCGASGPLPPVEVDGPGSSFDPRGPDEEVLGEEWVAFIAEDAVDIGGWVIRDESSEHRCHLPSDLTIEPGEVLRVTSADPCWDPGERSVWNNGGDMALLLDTTGRVVARHRYLGD